MTRRRALAACRPALMLCVVLIGSKSHADSSYAEDIAPIFAQRCVACHSCYNAPCQLDLSSWAGVARGATGARVYDGTRLTPAPPTRLNIDAGSSAEWHRDKGFYEVLDGSDGQARGLMQRMLDMKQAGPTPVREKHEDWLCPSNTLEMTAYALAGPDGMPFGFPPLSSSEAATLAQWLDAGSPGPHSDGEKPAKNLVAQIEAWEAWLNRDSNTARLVARYIYEHLFLAHLYFEDNGAQFYRLVRSRTPSGRTIKEIASVRPYDDPGPASFYYRLRPIDAAITHKTHIVFPLSPTRLERYSRWFSDPRAGAGVGALPPYGSFEDHNPFRVFASLDAAARYRFMLDNARYFVMSFIRGPVCEGQMAVNVIDDHFYVFFLDPEHDLAVTDQDYLTQIGELLQLPSAGESDPFDIYYENYKARQRRYTAAREQRYAEQWPAGQGLAAVWANSAGTGDDWLTVFRHFDNASVLDGGHGGTPKTVWVIDYPIFERIYYLLVAGFNVYGNAFHQAATRLYMDNLRVEAEDNFLAFLPPETRHALRDYWYRGDGAREKMVRENPLRGATRETAVHYESDDQKGEWLRRVRSQLGAKTFERAVLQDPLAAAKPARIDDRRAVDRWLANLVGRPLPFVQAMPDVALLSVSTARETLLYSLIRNKAHTNVSFLRDEADRRLPAEDSLSIVHGVVGSYPNYLFEVTANTLPQFVELLERYAGEDGERRQLWRGFGASRYEPDFWAVYDRFSALFQRQSPVSAGILDLSKYSYD